MNSHYPMSLDFLEAQSFFPLLGRKGSLLQILSLAFVGHTSEAVTLGIASFQGS